MCRRGQPKNREPTGQVVRHAKMSSVKECRVVVSAQDVAACTQRDLWNVCRRLPASQVVCTGQGGAQSGSLDRRTFGSILLSVWTELRRQLVRIASLDELSAFCSFVEPSVPRLPQLDAQWSRYMFIDLVSHEILLAQQRSEFEDMKPVETTADGNCLCNATSLFVFGSESFSGAIRSLIVVELTTNRERYLNSDYLALGCRRPHKKMHMVFAQYTEVYRSDIHLDDTSCGELFVLDAQRFRLPGSWGGLWQLAALANIAQRPVRVIYPSHLRCWTDFDRDFMPWDEALRCRRPILLMWTATIRSGPIKQLRQSDFCHFVPLLTYRD